MPKTKEPKPTSVTPPQPTVAGDDRFRVLVDAVTDYAIYMLDSNGTIVSWNSGAKHIKGYEEHEVLGTHFSRFYTDADKTIGLPGRELSRAEREGRVEGQSWRVRKDGTQFWAHVTIDPIRSPAGVLMGFAKVTRDLTRQRLAEMQLRRSEEQFRLLVQGVTDYAIYLLDVDGNVSSWNAGAERIKGYVSGEIIGKHFSTFYTEEDRASGEPQRILQAALRDGGCEREGLRFRKDGTTFWAHVVVDPIFDASGQLIGYAKITRDVTEKRKTDAALRSARESLIQSQKIDAIGQLTGGVAHDFNNLLMAIVGSLESLQRAELDPDRRKAMLENAMRASQRGVALTQRMLAFARKQELVVAPVDLPHLVTGMRDLLHRSLGPQITLELAFASGLPPVVADVNQLELALLNLAVNARDAMGQSGNLFIDAREHPLDRKAFPDAPELRYVRLTVRDDGEGMDETTLQRATEPFFTTKGVGKGTGLGLSMVQGVVEQCGGRLRLASAPGQGTTVEIYLPVADGYVIPRAVASAETPRESSPGRSLVVLAVDDDPLVLTNLVTMLEDLGHVPLTATSGDEALALLNSDSNIDLVITDFAMPRMTGLQLARAIASTRPSLPVIVATGYSEIPLQGTPFAQRLAKPFGFDDLARAIDAAAKNASS
jgi:PAS domain S-box-containing protein